MNHAERKHSRFGASSAHRWMLCPASVHATAGVEDRPSAAALEGTKAHELLEARLFAYINQAALDVDGSVPEDMFDAVSKCIEYVIDLLDEYPDAILLIEQQFEIPMAVAPGEVFGTADIIIFVPSMRLLYIIDYKHGQGIVVEVKGNKQLRFYALGALAKMKLEHPEWNIDSVAMVIVQPRIEYREPIREEWINVTDLLPFANEISAAILAAKDPGAPFVPGPVQCQRCLIGTTCVAREWHALAAIGGDFGHVREVIGANMPKPLELDDTRIGEIMAAAPSIYAWLAAVEKEAIARLHAGRPVPGQKLVAAHGRRQWEHDAGTTAAALAQISGLDPKEFLTLELKGLGDIEKILKQYAGAGLKRTEAAAAKKAALDQMALLTTKRSSGNLTIVPLSDDRPAVDKVNTAFKDVVQIPHIVNVNGEGEVK